MDSSDNQCDRQRHFHCPPASLAAVQSCAQANQSLDTVRSLHQTVVSLRNALDDARREISSLKQQMNVRTDIDEGKAFKENDPDHKKIDEKRGSQIDVKIRVSSNLNLSTGGGGGATQVAMEEGRGAPESARSVVNIKLTSQEHLDVSQQQESVYSVSQERSEEVQLETREEEEEGDEEKVIQEEEEEPLNDDEDKSLSDGDNSVFGDSKEGDELPAKNVLRVPQQKFTRAHSDTQEEVDDIELIFSSAEDDAHHRELHEEEMVSISTSYEPWQKPGSGGTPVLLSFERFSLEDEERQLGSVRGKQVSLDESTDSHKSHERAQFQKKTSLDRENGEQFKANLGGSKWQQKRTKELHMTDISKCGISEENIMDMGRRNTCPNPPVYRPLMALGQREAPPRHRNSLSANRCILGGKFTRPGSFLTSTPARVSLRSPLIAITNVGHSNEQQEQQKDGPKRSSSVQTDISALPDHWQSESHLAGGGYANGMFTLPSKFNPVMNSVRHAPRTPLRPSQRTTTQEARRVLLSDINFTSMIPELSRSADHLCPEEDGDEEEQENQRRHEEQQQEYCRQQMYHGHHLQTPHMLNYRKGLTPSASINSHGSMNENSFATQTTQTGDYWVHKGDSFDSASCYTNDSRLSLTNQNTQNKGSRSRSVPSIRCVYCKRSHGFTGMRTSESMHYTPRVVAIPESYGTVKGSLPDLRHDCCCPRRYQGHSTVRLHGPAAGSTESLMDDCEVFVGRSSNNNMATSASSHMDFAMGNRFGSGLAKGNRRCSENDIGRSYTPSKQSLPFLPKSAQCLKIGHLAKVIARNGRVVVGQVRYVGPICNAEYVARLDGGSHDTFIGLELPANGGDTDGTIEGKRFFYCEQNHGIFVPFPKVIMAWTS